MPPGGAGERDASPCRSPELDLDVNVRGTFNVLEAARAAARTSSSPRRAARSTATTRRCRRRRTVPPQPLAPYGASKLAGEAYVATWGRLHELPNVVLRLGNVYGPRQTPHGEAGVVAIFSDRLRRGEAPVVYGDGLQTRDYVHVADVADAFVRAAEARPPRRYNVGCGRGRPCSSCSTCSSAPPEPRSPPYSSRCGPAS